MITGDFPPSFEELCFDLFELEPDNAKFLI